MDLLESAETAFCTHKNSHEPTFDHFYLVRLIHVVKLNSYIVTTVDILISSQNNNRSPTFRHSYKCHPQGVREREKE